MAYDDGYYGRDSMDPRQMGNGCSQQHHYDPDYDDCQDNDFDMDFGGDFGFWTYNLSLSFSLYLYLYLSIPYKVVYACIGLAQTSTSGTKHLGSIDVVRQPIFPFVSFIFLHIHQEKKEKG